MTIRKKTNHVKQLYNDVAHHYDESIINEHDYKGPVKLVSYLTPYLDGFRPVRRSNANSVFILDIGIGTGMLSQVLHEQFDNITLSGVDLSGKMLAQCRKKNITKGLYTCDIANENLPFNRNAFDVSVSCGVFDFLDSLHHAFHEMARVTAVGGLVAFAYEEDNSGDINPTGGYIYTHSFNYIRNQLAVAGIEILLKKSGSIYYIENEPQQAGLIVGRVL